MSYAVTFKRVYKNVHWNQAFQLFSNTAGTTPVDISSATMEMDIVTRGASPTVVKSLSLGDGIELTTDGTDGKFQIILPSSEMTSIPVATYKYDLIMTRAGVSEMIMEGLVTFVSGVTAP